MQAEDARRTLEEHTHRLVGGPGGDETTPRIFPGEPLSPLIIVTQGHAVARVALHFPNHEEHPRNDRLRHHFGALGLEETLQMVIAIAFRRHRPELADDAHRRLHA